jgi:hypothetical protein
MAKPCHKEFSVDEATHKKYFKPINIRDLLMAKNPRLAPWIPGFVYRLLSRMLRIDFMNDPILYNHGYKKDVDFARASIEAFNVSLEVKGREHLPGKGRFIFVPINKHGAQAMDNVRRINALFASDQQLMSFPAGLVSRRRKGVIRDVAWQKSIITKAKQTHRDIIAIHVTGRCSSFFYNLANIRKFLRIKTNLEMFFLPNESYKHRNKHFTISFGKPISYKTFDKRFTPIQWASFVQDYTYSLVNNPDGEFPYLCNEF